MQSVILNAVKDLWLAGCTSLHPEILHCVQDDSFAVQMPFDTFLGPGMAQAGKMGNMNTAADAAAATPQRWLRPFDFAPGT